MKPNVLFLVSLSVLVWTVARAEDIDHAATGTVDGRLVIWLEDPNEPVGPTHGRAWFLSEPCSRSWFASQWLFVC